MNEIALDAENLNVATCHLTHQHQLRRFTAILCNPLLWPHEIVKYVVDSSVGFEST